MAPTIPAPTIPAPPLRDNELYDGEFTDGTSEPFLWTPEGALTISAGCRHRNDLERWREIEAIEVEEDSPPTERST